MEHRRTFRGLFILMMLTMLLWARPALAAGSGTVRGDAGTVRLRWDAGTEYDSMRILPAGEKLILEAAKKDRYGNIWYRVTYSGSTGFVKGSCLKKNQEAEEVLFYPREEKTTETVSLYSGVGTGYKVIKKLSAGTVVRLITERKTGSGTRWYELYCADGTHGYAKAAGFSGHVRSADIPAGLLSMGTGKRTGKVSGISILYLREGPGTKYARLDMLPRGTSVKIYGECIDTKGQLWYKTRYNSVRGYLKAQYISEGDSQSGGQEPEETPSMTFPHYAVTRTAAPLRTGCGPDYQIIKELKSGTYIRLLAQKTTKAGYLWYQAELSSGEKGYIIASKVNTGPSQTKAKEAFQSGLDYPLAAKVTAAGTTLRTGAGSGYTGLVTLKKNDVLKLLAGKVNSSGALWYKAQSADGAAGYVKAADVTTTVSGSLIPATLMNDKCMATASTAAAIRKSADSDAAKLKTLPLAGRCQVLGAKKDSSGKLWYKVSYSGVTGYVKGSYISADAAFDQMLRKEGFPKDYRTKLLTLHKKYPRWTFTADSVSFNFDYVVKQQYAFKSGYLLPAIWYGTEAVSLIEVDSPASWKSKDANAYNSRTGKWYTHWDGGDYWAIASKDLVRYCLDPRNFLDSTYIFQFLDLTFGDDVTVSDVKQGAKVIGADWLASTSWEHENGDVMNYPKTIFNAGLKYDVNPVFLVMMIALENGLENSEAPVLRGTMPGYRGIYNYFNIGAFTDEDYSTTWSRGLYVAGKKDSKWNRPWNTRTKAINGGASYYSSEYINGATRQNSIYYIRFDVFSETAREHQFSTSILQARDIGKMMSRAYTESMRKESRLEFRIPVYKNMPAAVCGIPGGN